MCQAITGEKTERQNFFHFFLNNFTQVLSSLAHLCTPIMDSGGNDMNILGLDATKRVLPFVKVDFPVVGKQRTEL